MYVCTHACMYVCMYACMYVCMYVCTPILTPIFFIPRIPRKPMATAYLSRSTMCVGPHSPHTWETNYLRLFEMKGFQTRGGALFGAGVITVSSCVRERTTYLSSQRHPSSHWREYVREVKALVFQIQSMVDFLAIIWAYLLWCLEGYIVLYSSLALCSRWLVWLSILKSIVLLIFLIICFITSMRSLIESRMAKLLELDPPYHFTLPCGNQSHLFHQNSFLGSTCWCHGGLQVSPHMAYVKPFSKQSRSLLLMWWGT